MAMLVAILVAVKNLPPTIRQALGSIGYYSADIQVAATEEITPTPHAYGDGYQGVGVILNLATGYYKVLHTSWGGPNPFQKTVGDATTEQAVKLTENMAIVHAQKGGSRGTCHGATIYVSPATLTPMLPPKAQTTEMDQRILYCLACLKSFARKEEMQRAGVTEAHVVSLIERGLAKRNKAGALSITLEGKNARDERRASCWCDVCQSDYHPNHHYCKGGK